MASNEALVRALWLAHREGRIDKMLDLLHPAIVWHPLSRPGLSVYAGHDGVRQMIEDMRLFVGDYVLDIDTYTEVGEDQVVVRGRVVPSAGDPLSIEMELTFADGLIQHVVTRRPTEAA